MTTMQDRPIVVPTAGRVAEEQVARPTADVRPVPTGWGSHAERRMVRHALAFFLLLGLYATVFVLIGTLRWT